MNNMTTIVETINGNRRSSSITYDLDNRVTSLRKGSVTEAYTYDDYSRVSDKTTTISDETRLTEHITYRAPSTGITTGQIASLTIDAANHDVTYSYTYDKNGNILSVSDGTHTTTYTYDSANQLTRENNQAEDKTWTWTYDNAGNILSRSEYGYTTGDLSSLTPMTVSYAYTDADWGDLLTSYNGQTIQYDEIGNPLTDGTWTYTWQHGRELASMTDGSTTWNYTYNADGLRTKRTNGSLTYQYYYADGQLVRIAVGNKYLDISYDASGTPMSLYYSGYQVGDAKGNYYYVTNVQGDVVAIVNDAGEAVVTYTYDAWGNILEVGGSMASTLGVYNPLRYRGYVYDNETGLYYVSSRYYDPEIGRFINADDIDYLGADGSPLSYNLFAYCMNNPVNRFDVNGNWSLPNWAKVTIGAVAIAGLAVATVCTGGAAAVICGAALSGAIAGGASGAVMGAIGGGISGGWQGALDGACSGFMSGTLIGGVTGAASAGLNIATGATTVVGNAHGSTLHKLATNMEAGKMAASRQYSQIGVNKALKTMGLNGTSRPDVIGVAKNGMNKIVEVVSPRQSTNYIINKMSNMLSNNPGSVGKIVNWVRRLFK